MSTYPRRISEIVNILNRCSLLADVGCDHAYVCILAVDKKKADKAIALDINKGPLLRAQKNIDEAGLSRKISVCLSDGLISLNALPDAVTICGMGGLLIRDILRSSPEKLTNTKQLVLGPQSEIPELRKYLEEESEFFVYRETVMQEQEKYYVIMDVRRKEDFEDLSWSEDEYLAGKPSIQSDPLMYRNYLCFLMAKYKNASEKINSLSENASLRKEELFSIFSSLKKTYEDL